MPLFNPQDQVQRRNNPTPQIGVVQQVLKNPQTGATQYRVTWGAQTQVVPESSLIRFVPASSLWDDLRGGLGSGAKGLRYALTFQKLRQPASRVAGAFSGARTRFFPFQFKPLLKFLDNGEKRILIGDDVGLGKTIEAGYILTELQTSQRLDHVMILVPSRLRTKWRTELQERFHRPFTIPERAEVETYLRALQQNKEVQGFHWICSYESMRSVSILHLLKEVTLPLDLLIVDEAHRVRNTSTQQHALARALTTMAENIVFLSATPVQTRLRDLWVLLNLLSPDEFGDEGVFESRMVDNQKILALARELGAAQAPLTGEPLRQLRQRFEKSRKQLGDSAMPLSIARRLAQEELSHSQLVQLQADVLSLSPIAHIFTRTRKREALPNVPRRDASWCSVRLSAGEKALYNSVIELCQRAGNQGASDAQTFACVMAYRMVASCIPASLAYLGGQESSASLAPGDIEDGDTDDDTEQPLPSLASLRDAVLVNAVRLYKQEMELVDSKFEKFHSELCQLWEADQQRTEATSPPGARRKVVLFSYFTRTLDYLEGQLRERGIPCRKIHGRIGIADRERAIEEFLTLPGVDLLLTSDVGGEGIDLQVASILFNYDLPWNPMVVEQRIGRIDRIGQREERLIIRNFVVEGSIEERILERLFERIGIFNETVGEIDPILGETESVEDLTRRALLGKLTEQELQEKLLQHERIREQERRHTHELHERVDALGAADQALLDEINAVEGDEQLPTEAEMLAYVNTTLEHVGAGVQLPETTCHSVVPVFLGSLLDQAREANDDPSYGLFARRAATGQVFLTLSREVAYRHPSCELVHSHHPLARWARHVAPPPARVFRLLLSDSSFPPGRYLLLLAAVELAGVARCHRLVQTAVRLEPFSCVLLPDEEAARLLQLARHSRESHGASLSLDDIGACEQVLSARLDTLANEWAQREGAAEQARLDRRRAASEASHKQKIEAIRRLLSQLQERQAPAFPVRMAQDRLTKALAAQQQSREAPLHATTLSPSYEELALLFIEVTPSEVSA